MTLKQIKERYDVYKLNDKYLLYHLTESGVMSPIKYLCYLVKTGVKYSVDGYTPTSNINTLQEQIDDKLASYEWNSEYYNPCYRDGLFEELAIRDYLGSLGFTRKFGSTETFTNASKNMYGKSDSIELTIHGLDCHNMKDTVRVCYFSSGFSWTQIECKREIPEIIESIKRILRPLVEERVNYYNKLVKTL